MIEEPVTERATVRDPLPPMAEDNPEQIRHDLKQGELSGKLRSALQEYRKTKRNEVLRRIFSVLGGAFRTLRTTDASQGIAVMQNLAPKMEGMTPTEKAEAIAPLVKQLSEEEQKRASEYGKLVSESIKTEKEALKDYLSLLGKGMSSQATAIKPQIDALKAGLRAELEGLEVDGSGMSPDTQGIARSIKSAALAHSKSDGLVDQKEFKKYTQQEATRVLNDPTIESSQKAALLRNLRPSLPQHLMEIRDDNNKVIKAYSVDDAIREHGANVEQDDVETTQKRSALIADFQKNVRRYWPSTSKFLKNADAKLSNASANTNKAITEFIEKNPMDTVFAPSEAAKSAQTSIKKIREAPDRAFRSQILKGKISEMEGAQPYMQGPEGFKGLLEAHKRQRQARRRGEVFKTPAPPEAVQGATAQVAVDEEPDGTNTTAA